MSKKKLLIGSLAVTAVAVLGRRVVHRGTLPLDPSAIPLA